MPNTLEMRTLFNSRDDKTVSKFGELINIITAKLA